MANISLDTVCTSGKYLVDANVWIYLYSPIIGLQDEDKAYAYGKFVQKLTSSNDCQILITPLLISEYINVRMRVYYSTFLVQTGKERTKYSFKRYREDNHSDYAKYIPTVLGEVRNILKDCCIVYDLADDMLAQNIFDRLLEKSLDVNDSFFVELCKQQCAKFVTEDGDFVNCGIDVISDNRRYN